MEGETKTFKHYSYPMETYPPVSVMDRVGKRGERKGSKQSSPLAQNSWAEYLLMLSAGNMGRLEPVPIN